MGAQPRRVGRPRKRTHRVELRLNADDPMVAALEAEAAQRHVTLQQHITDVLTARYLSRSLRVETEESAPDTPGMAQALSNEWM